MVKALNSDTKKTNLVLILVLLLSFMSVAWTLSPLNTLTFDDFTLMTQAKFTSFNDLFSLLPTHSYNDRSFRMLFLKMLITAFGDSYVAYHIVFVASHLFNVWLVYMVSRIIFRNAKIENGSYYALVAAGVFGIYPKSLMAVQWISSTCDFQCCTFVLLSALLYLKARDNDKNCIFYAIGSFLCFWASLRCKEMSLALPVVFALYEFGLAYALRRRVSIPWYLYLQIAFMLFYAFLLFSGGQSSFDSSSPYYMVFNPLVMLKDASHYVAMYMNPFDQSLVFAKFSVGSYIAVGVFGAIVLFSIWRFARREPGLLLSLLCAGCILVVVLPMINMQHRLYLYIPSAFMGISFAFLTKDIVELFHFKDVTSIALVIPFAVFLLCFTNASTGFNNWWLSSCQNDAAQYKQLLELKPVESGTTVYITGASDGDNIFFYGPGNSLRWRFSDPSISTQLVSTYPSDIEGHYLLLQSYIPTA